jgi:GAF domain-containing protein
MRRLRATYDHRSTDALERRSLDRLAGVAADLLRVEVVVISVLEGRAQLIVGSHGVVPLINRGCAYCGAVARSACPVVIHDAISRLPALVRHGWGIDLVAYAGVPLAPVGSLVGTMAAFSSELRSWLPRDLLVLRSLADAAAGVLDAWSMDQRSA